MNLFNYLMNKKGKKLVDNDHMLEYLLNKGTTQEKEATGTNINITDVTKAKIIKLTLDKESTQTGTPTPENPVEIKTVKGYRNLFDIPNGTYTNTDTMTIEDNVGHFTVTANRTINVPTNFILKAGTYTLTNGGHIYPYFTLKSNNTNIVALTSNDNGTKVFTLENDTTIDNVAVYQTTSVYASNDFIFQITEGTEELPYAPYGNNWIYTKVSNGTDTNYYTIPLNNNEVVGIGDYKDELIVDKNGHCWLNKKIEKKIFTDSDRFVGQYSTSSRTGFWTLISGIKPISSVNEIPNLLSTKFISVSMNASWKSGNMSMVTYSDEKNKVFFFLEANKTVDDIKNVLVNQPIYYPLATPQLINLNYTVDIRLFKGVNNITNSDNMNMTLIYK